MPCLPVITREGRSSQLCGSTLQAIRGDLARRGMREVGGVPDTVTSGGFISDLGARIGGAIGGDTGRRIGGALGREFEGNQPPPVGSGFPGGPNILPGQFPQGGIPGTVGSSGPALPRVIPRRGTTLAAPTGTCQPPLMRSSSGLCVAPGSPAVGAGGAGVVMDAPLARGIGQATLGVYGAGWAPGVRQTAVSVCPTGTVLGKDGVCYDRKAIRNSERAHPKPRKPLLTGGDLNAISKASRAAGRLERQTKRLQKLGMIKKPTRRRS